MKKDIIFPAVEGVKVAVARKQNELNQYDWHVYLLNNNNFDLTNILIASKGYGTLNGEPQKTSTLRQLIPTIAANEYVLIEAITPEIFHLCNEYWVSYYIGNKPEIYDKKFIFLPETITEANIISIKSLNLEGILHD